MEEVVGVESRVASNGLERIRIEGETPGWVSLRLLEPADGAAGAKDRTLVVEWREAKVVLKKIALDTDRGATCGDVKRSLFAMTRVAVARPRRRGGPRAGASSCARPSPRSCPRAWMGP